MEQISDNGYFEAKKEMEVLKKTVDPLAAILLINEYKQIELESIVRKLPVDIIERIDIRFHLIYQLLQNRKNKILEPLDYLDSSKSDSLDDKFCDFKTVLTILGRGKSTVEVLITKGDINPINYKPGKKRRFLRADIIKYAEGLS